MQLTVEIPENKVDFFLELMASLEFVHINNTTDGSVITEGQKRLINEELRKISEDKNYLLDWKEARKTLKFRDAL